MKLRELLKEAVSEDAFYDWWEANVETYSGPARHVDYEDGKITINLPNGHAAALITLRSSSRWNPPVDSNDWDSLAIRWINLKGYALPTFDKVPNVEVLHLDGVSLGSWRGIEKLDKLEHLYLGDHIDSDRMPKNILRLYKCKNLEETRFNYKYPYKVVEIFTKHFAERDITEAIDELISEGYKEYAKL
jgi:hypothetical protein